MQSLNGQFLSTVGMELESVFLDARCLSTGIIQRLAAEGKVQITRDASVESYVKYFKTGGEKNLPVYTHTDVLRNFAQAGRLEAYPKGYELIINPTEISEIGKLLFDITNYLVRLGDYESERASVHYHIGFVNNLRMMKNLLKICLFLDPFLYRLGGMGGVYRGYSNNSAYARPLLNSCVVPIRSSGSSPRIQIDFNPSIEDEEETEEPSWEEEEEGRFEGHYAQIINTERALAAQKTEDFWASFGVFPQTLGLPKYHPTRYTGCNFYAIPSHGTFEFRHCNQSLNPFLLLSVGKFLRGVVELSTLIKKTETNQFFPQNPNEELSMKDSANTMDILLRHFREKEIEDIPTPREVTLIMDTVEASTFEPLSSIPVISHNREYYIPQDLVERYGLNIVTKASKPKQIDIHTIRNYPLVP